MHTEDLLTALAALPCLLDEIQSRRGAAATELFQPPRGIAAGCLRGSGEGLQRTRGTGPSEEGAQRFACDLQGFACCGTRRRGVFKAGDENVPRSPVKQFPEPLLPLPLPSSPFPLFSTFVPSLSPSLLPAPSSLPAPSASAGHTSRRTSSSDSTALKPPTPRNRRAIEEAFWFDVTR